MSEECDEARERILELDGEILRGRLRRDMLESGAQKLEPLVEMARELSDPVLLQSATPKTPCFLLGWAIFWLRATGRADLMVPFELAIRAGWVSCSKRTKVEQVIMLALESIAKDNSSSNLP